MNIVVTGSTGFLGQHLLPILAKRYGDSQTIGLSSKDYDLLDIGQVRKMIEHTKPDVLIHLAALSGGILDNRERPADFYFQNSVLTANVFEMAAQGGVPKLIYPMGGCSYPDDAISPIDESQMWSGFPNAISAGYSCAKKMGIVAADCYFRQYGMKSVVLVPGNMYGEFDNYHATGSHVIPGLIRRFFEAIQDKRETLTVWGTGKAKRDFVYAGDVAAVFPYFIDNDNESGPINISTGTTTSIRELTELIAEIYNFQGTLQWDTSKPDGQAVKIFAVNKLNSHGLVCNTPLAEGLKKTIDWFRDNYNRPGAVRL